MTLRDLNLIFFVFQNNYRKVRHSIDQVRNHPLWQQFVPNFSINPRLRSYWDLKADPASKSKDQHTIEPHSDIVSRGNI